MKWRPRTLVIGPGGTKGYLALGFLSTLEDENFLDKTDTYAGVSVGSIISLLLVVGYNSRDIVGISEKLEMFKDASSFSFIYVLENQGLVSNQPIYKALYNLVKEKLGVVPNLYDLYMKTGKSLITVTLNTTDRKEEIMTPFTHGNICCIDAVMYSMNIPFVFYKLIRNHKTYVDGALANPYPVDFFDNGEENILGIFMSNLEEEEKKIITKIKEDVLTFMEYAGKILTSLLLQRRNSIIKRCSDKCRHVHLIYDSKDMVSVFCSEKEKIKMLVKGYNAGKDFLKMDYQDFPLLKEEKYEYPVYEL